MVDVLAVAEQRPVAVALGLAAPRELGLAIDVAAGLAIDLTLGIGLGLARALAAGLALAAAVGRIDVARGGALGLDVGLTRGVALAVGTAALATRTPAREAIGAAIEGPRVTRHLALALAAPRTLHVEARVALARAPQLEVGGTLRLEGHGLALSLALHVHQHLALGIGLDVDVAAGPDPGLGVTGPGERKGEGQGGEQELAGSAHGDVLVMSSWEDARRRANGAAAGVGAWTRIPAGRCTPAQILASCPRPNAVAQAARCW